MSSGNISEAAKLLQEAVSLLHNTAVLGDSNTSTNSRPATSSTVSAALREHRQLFRSRINRPVSVSANNKTRFVLLERGAKTVSAYVTHPVFPNNSWKNFVEGESDVKFTNFWITDSIPHAREIAKHKPFKLLSLGDAIADTLLGFDLLPPSLRLPFPVLSLLIYVNFGGSEKYLKEMSQNYDHSCFMNFNGIEKYLNETQFLKCL